MTAPEIVGRGGGDTDRLRSQLTEVLSLVLDMQKFAEAKLALLLTSTVGVGVGVVALFHSDRPPEGLWCSYLVLLSVFDSLAVIVSLTGLVPRTGLPILRQTAGAGENNILFFEHIQRYSRTAYLDAVADALELRRDKFTKIEEDYSAQIIRNAQVASRKFAAFRNAMWLLVHGLLTPIGGMAVYALYHSHDEKHDSGLVIQ